MGGPELGRARRGRFNAGACCEVRTGIARLKPAALAPLLTSEDVGNEGLGTKTAEEDPGEVDGADPLGLEGSGVSEMDSVVLEVVGADPRLAGVDWLAWRMESRGLDMRIDRVLTMV